MKHSARHCGGKKKKYVAYSLISLLSIYSRNENKCPYKTCTQMFIAASFVITKRWKQPECPSVDKWINKMWYSYTTEYYLARKRNEVPIPATI